ncbi:PhoX family phosphatase [Rhodobacteraceae bacterium 10Alg 79]|uniref:PhoX family phosphatase n=2 Tax=Rhodalgimonas zhirmunskyi TaxID=2964767 RepID=A0AAJ1U491_9RHOB|nr:PhoX family phosphatase [Rhodoalgimonas zhirmunskyi]MDQ2092699.1 PhoX family phosphatase [Rhodoalgimonas zhirmunskyi]
MQDRPDLSFDAFDEAVSPRPEACEFDDVVTRALTRRGFLGGVLASGGVATLAASLPFKAHAETNRFPFAHIAANTDDTVTLPPGYSAQVVIRWGDPLWSDGAPFDPETRGTADTQARAFGDNTDGMELFTHSDAQGDHLLLAVNSEYTNRKIIWGNRADASDLTRDDLLKGMRAHGVTILELARTNDGWAPVLDSPFTRRITPETKMQITGPAAGHPLQQTQADPTGTTCLGTWNNCGSGRTPWGTYLACEENFNGYFSASDPAHAVTPELARYGISARDWGYGWARIDSRFDISQHPNEANRAGYVVEIDPTDPTSTPKKRSALGRFKHENAEVVIAANGRVVIYMGDDERGEFLYRYVSHGSYTPDTDPEDLMTNGTLYAAEFNDDGTGTWRALTPETTGMDNGEIHIHTRQAASAVGATTMDRPEWVAANPTAPEVYCCLTNNKNRGLKPNAGGDATPATGPNPRTANPYGQIVRWRPDNGDHTAPGFNWDLYLLAGNPNVHADAYAGSDNITPDIMFNSPDGLAFDSTGLLWIQTDGNTSNTGDFAGHGNNQMLAGDPVTGELRRFLVGPNHCEVTGACWSPDRATLFVGIQHPGDKGDSHWPDGGDSVPRSAIIAITRNDGGKLG